MNEICFVSFFYSDEMQLSARITDTFIVQAMNMIGSDLVIMIAPSYVIMIAPSFPWPRIQL